MIRSEKQLKGFAEILKKNNTLLIIKAIDSLRIEKPFEGVVGLLTAFYDQSDEFTVRKTISGFLNDLKDQSVCAEIIKEIRKKWKADTISMLVSSCWQSGLDYSDYSLDLVKIFLKGDYVTAIECLTVIEESVDELSSDRKDEIIKIIEQSPVSEINEKKGLALELISILER
jgi:hypothetical protein